MTVPITSDLDGYQRFWARWIRIALFVVGVGFATLVYLLCRIWEAVR